MRDFQNAFDAALAGVDSTIVEVMGIRAQFTSGAQRGGEVQGVFDDPESLGFAGGGVRIEGSSPSLFVRTDTVRAVRRGDTLTINGEMFWVDRVSPDDGGSCYLWLNRGQPEEAEASGNLQVSVEDLVRTGAFLVAMSLWHNHPQKTQSPSMNEAVMKIEQEVLTTWPADAIARAEDVVLRLSGMIEAVRPDTDITEVAKNNTLTDDDFSAGKSSTVS